MQAYGGIQTHVSSLKAALHAIGCDALSRVLPSDSIYHAPQPGDEPRLPNEGLEAALCELIGSQQIDVLHAHNVHIEYTSGLQAKLTAAAQKCGVPLVITVHDISPGHFDGNAAHVRTGLPGAHFVVTSAYNYTRFTELFGVEPIAQIPPALNFSAFDGDTQPEPRTIAYPGRLTEDKGALDAVHLLGRLSQRIGPLRVLLSDRTRKCVGESTQFFSELDAAFQDYEHLEGEYLDGVEAASDIYRRAAITLAMPRLIEGFGLVPLESIASLRPVVAIPSGGMHWLNGVPGTLTAKSGRTEEIADGIATVIADWPEWHAKVRGSRELLKTRFDAKLTAREHLSLYDRLCRTRTSEKVLACVYG